MTDLEIMLMLEEEGYEPSIENVQIFKEEYLDESSKAQRRRAREWRPKDPFDFSYSIDADRTARILDKHMLGRRASKLIAKHREMIATGKPDLSGIHSERIKSHPEWMGAEARAEIRRGKREKERIDHLNGKNIDNNHGDKPINASVEYSDYELYQMLDESGYKPTERNLSILKEGLESGKYEILDEGVIKNFKDNMKYNHGLNKEAEQYSEEKINRRIYGLSDIDALKPGEDVEIRKDAREKREAILSKKVPFTKIFSKRPENDGK